MALTKKRFAALASLFAVSRQSTVWPLFVNGQRHARPPEGLFDG
jgi:hypothetical protein